MAISINTQRLVKLLNNGNRDDIVVFIGTGGSCCVHPGGSEVYTIDCGKRMAIRIIHNFKLGRVLQGSNGMSFMS